MTRQFLTLCTAGVLCASLTTTAFAASPTAGPDKENVIPKLEQQAHRFAWEARATKGIPRAQREFQSLRVKRLIERLQAGEAVDPQEIDKLLKEQPWPR